MFNWHLKELKRQHTTTWSESSKARQAANAVIRELAGEWEGIPIPIEEAMMEKRLIDDKQGNLLNASVRRTKRICTATVQQTKNDRSF